MESGRKEKVLAFMGAVPDIPTKEKGKRLSVGRMDLVLWRSSRIILRKASSKGKPKKDSFPFVHFTKPPLLGGKF